MNGRRTKEGRGGRVGSAEDDSKSRNCIMVWGILNMFMVNQWTLVKVIF